MKKYRTPWPTEKPDIEPFQHGWLVEGTKNMLLKHLRPDMKVIVELGVWLGKSTQFFLEQCPDALVYSVDLWDKAMLTRWAKNRHPHLLHAARRPLEQFMVNLWDQRGRVVPMQMDSMKAIAALKESGVEPDLIYLDTSHTYPHTRDEIRAIKAAFPNTQLVGDDWEWGDNRRHRLPVQRSVFEYIRFNMTWDVEHDGNGWALIPAGRGLEAKGPTRIGYIAADTKGKVGGAIQKTGTYYEADLLNAIAEKNLHGVYIDVGAHIGNHTAFFALECPSTQVLAIEPSDEAFERLKRTVFVNNLTRKVKTYQVGIHDTWSTATWQPSSQIVVDPKGQVPCIRLDDIMPEERVAVIKVDVEGLEANVLRSAEKLIQRDHPMLSLETWSPEATQDLKAILGPWGYVQGPRYCATPTHLWEWSGGE